MSDGIAQAQQPPAFQAELPRDEIARVLRRRRRLRAGIVQLLFLCVAIALGFLVPKLGAGFPIPSNRAVEMLIAVGAGTVAFIGIVFSLLFLVVQYSSTAFTPRLNLFRDAPIVWRAFALYTAVIAYSFTASLVIGRSEYTSAVVPIIAFVGVVVSLIVFRRLQSTAFESIQLASTLAEVAKRGREVIDGLYVHPAGSLQQAASIDLGESPRELRWSARQGTLQVIDVPGMLAIAERHGDVIELRVGSGQIVAEGAVVAMSGAGGNAERDAEILARLTLGNERTFEQDPMLALRLLADIALRALSPAVNDPTTAVQAIDAIESLLRALCGRALDVGRLAGSDGTIRLALVLPTWGEYLTVALEDIVSLQELAPSVARRIRQLLENLEAVAAPERRSELEAYRSLLAAAAR